MEDFEKVLSQGPWIVYGQYLTVQPWIKDFSTSQRYPSMVMAWIRLPGLLGHMYKRRILWEIGGTIGNVAKLDFNTDAGIWGRFVRLAVYVNLDKHLIPQVLINEALQRVEYEYLPIVCFSCRHYGYIKELFPKEVNGQKESGGRGCDWKE
ncbi:hypothetical protein PVK06_001499 [Gossypium arboreum]|uniref:DUF4283 domain-containing protein n=1 Tax=Gossypium arboreum TaxID=29729 RepID=A0ABR0R262_GOSAR|nr:hypothetical protein PVK06_001499 [Gossypium arboreum]